MSGIATVSGLVSGLNTSDIVSKLVAVAQLPIKELQSEQTTFTQQLTAYQSLNTQLLALKLKADAITTPAGFQARSVTISDNTALTASATSQASPGSYAITINQLAQAGQMQSQGYGDISSTTIGTGSLTVGAGSAAKALTIDSTNNTLGGLRDAINQAGVGVTATIIDLGSLSAHDYHLVLTGNSTGSANAITFTPALAGGTAPTMTTTATATDASITIGTGPGATTLTKSSNTITDVVPGLSLNLLTANPAKQLNVTIGTDTSHVSQSIQDFVTQYNSVIQFFNSQFSFDPQTKQGGVLLGDFQLQSIQQQFESGVLAVVPGVSGGLTSLSQIGITAGADGQLSVDTTQLNQALSSNPAGVSALFAATGQTTDQTVSYVVSTNQTKATGAGAPYQVQITQTALQPRVTAGAAQTANLGGNETLTINGTAIALTAGTTQAQVIAQINSFSNQTGVTALGTLANGTGTGSFLSLQSVAFGSAIHVTALSNVSNGGGMPSANTSGIGTVQVTEASPAGQTGSGTGNAGRDVAGSFGATVNGASTTETATGAGQILTGASGNANTDGLAVRVTATTTGAHGQVTLTQGIASQMDNLLAYLTSPNGAVTTAENSLNSQITDLGTQIDAQNQQLTAYQTDLTNQFNQLEVNLSQLQSQGSFLASQFAAINNQSSSTASRPTGTTQVA